MVKRYRGGIMSATQPNTTTNSGGMWNTVEQQQLLSPAGVAYLAATGGTSGPSITSITVTDIGFNNLDDTAVNSSNAFIKITGTGFSATSNVYIAGTKVSAANVTFTSSTELRVVLPVLTVGTSNPVSVFNSTGSGAIYVSDLLVSGFPSVTSSYVSGTQTVNTQLLATGDGALTYSLKAGSSLPAGLTLSANGLILGTVTVDSTTSFTVLVDDAQNQTTQQDITLVISSIDAYFNHTTLLLKADNVSNSSTNSGFVDSSNNYNLVVPAGTPIQGTINPFGVGNWSNSLNGTSQYLTVPISSPLQFGTGNFTIECWTYLTSKTTNQPAIFSNYNNFTSGALSLFAGHSSSSTTLYQVAINGTFPAIQSTTTIAYNTWVHLAVVRNAGIVTLYVNGVANGTVDASLASLNGVGSSFTIGTTSDNIANGYISGYISNFRAVKGTAVYTSAFTPSTTPLTTIANTSLLTCRSNSFKDESTNALTITPTGSPAVDRFNPFDVNANVYTTDANASVGSTYFASGYQTFPKTAFGTGDWSVEFWVYPTVASGGSIYSDFFQNYAGDYGLIIGWANTYFNAFIKRDNSFESGVLTAGSSLTLNQWYHVAVCRTSGIFSIFLNGVRGGTQTYTPSMPNTQAGIGNNGSGSSYQGNSQFNAGYLSNFRIMTGSSAYDARTSSFTVPTAPLTVTANTTLLTCRSSQIASRDIATGTALSTAGTLTPSRLVPPTLYSAVTDTSTANTVYGGSIFFNGSSDYLNVPSNSQTAVQSGNFTMEGWFYFTNANANALQTMFSNYTSFGAGSNSIYWGKHTYQSGTVAVWISNYSASAPLLVDPTLPPLNQWVHYALVRNGNAFNLYRNGVSVATATYASSITASTNPIYIGTPGDAINQYNFSGYISNFRILKGTAVYTTTFTPPTAPLQTIANTALLVSGINSGIYDQTLQNNIRGGGASVSTDVYKYGTGSMFFNGSSSFLQVGTTPGTLTPLLTAGAVLTIECWVYPTVLRAGQSTNQAPAIIGLGGTYMNFGVENGAPKLYWWTGSPNAITSSISIAATTWSHIALVFNGTGSNNTKIYVNGVLGATGTFTNISWASDAGGNNFLIGREGLGGTSYWPGYIDDLRITRSARYTANFTPPILGFNGQSRSS